MDLQAGLPKQYLYDGLSKLLPGPSHILKPQHPKYSKNTYDQFETPSRPNT